MILLEDCKIEKKDDKFRYAIISKLGSAYSIFVSTFHSIREALWVAYTPPSLETFCDYWIREKYKFVHLGVINTIGIFKKVLVSQ